MLIIGLGNTGCNIAEKFEKVENTNVICIDSNIEGDNCVSLNEFSTPEEYEKNVPDLKQFFNNSFIDEKEVFLIVGGSGKISGASLSILKQFKEKEINVIYIRPELNVLNESARLQDRLVFNVFQEYARSGVFKKCFLISNNIVEVLLGEIPLIGFYEKLNDVIFNALGFIVTHQNKNGIVNNLLPLKQTERICSVGFFDIATEQESLLYELTDISNKQFYFVFNEERLKTDGSLSKKIKQIMQNKSDEKTKSSYIIYQSKQPEEYCYMVAYTKQIQT